LIGLQAAINLHSVWNYTAYYAENILEVESYPCHKGNLKQLEFLGIGRIQGFLEELLFHKFLRYGPSFCRTKLYSTIKDTSLVLFLGLGEVIWRSRTDCRQNSLCFNYCFCSSCESFISFITGLITIILTYCWKEIFFERWAIMFWALGVTKNVNKMKVINKLRFYNKSMEEIISLVGWIQEQAKQRLWDVDWILRKRIQVTDFNKWWFTFVKWPTEKKTHYTSKKEKKSIWQQNWIGFSRLPNYFLIKCHTKIGIEAPVQKKS